MSLILVAGTEPGAGATTVAVGLAHLLAYSGRSVRIERLAGDDRADADAETFGWLEVAGSTGAPVEITGPPESDDGNAVTVLESPAGEDLTALEAGAARLGARLVLVAPEGPEGALALPSTPAGATLIANHALRSGARRVAEDRTLAAPTVGRLIEATGARVLARSAEGESAICEHVVIGPISHDAADAYFYRFANKAVVTRAEKVDLALAAMLTGATCLILSGGNDPSPYIIDRVAASRETTLLLAPEGTVETVRDIEGTFGTAPFAGETKVERIGALMREVIDDETLAALVEPVPAAL